MWFTLAFLLVATAPAEDGAPLPEDLQQLQGVWQLGKRDAVSIELENRGHVQTLRAYRRGELTHEHMVEFVLSRSGELKVFRWKNGHYTFGPRKGAAVPDGRFVYRLNDGKWTTVEGLFPDDGGKPVLTQEFKKIAD